jgi:hypothetical protein
VDYQKRQRLASIAGGIATSHRPDIRYMAPTLDGRVEASGAIFEAKFMLPWSFSDEPAAEKYMPQLRHNGGGIVRHYRGRQWVERAPNLVRVEPPKPRAEGSRAS